MSVQLFNTLSGKKETVKPGRGKQLKLFVCGPTVYDHSHIGHARTYIFFDFLVKYLRSQGLDVFYLQNITNIDDRIIKRAREEKKNPLRLADFFTKEYLKDMKMLGVDAVDAYAPATKFIPAIVHQVETLIKKGYAYKVENDGYYFDISRFSDYGKLSKRTVEQAEDSVSRIDESVQKKNRGDFALWKLAHPNSAIQMRPSEYYKVKVINGEPLWNTRLGWGRPGWHIEDTAISEHYFGPQYDIHGGGLDLKFPHHEAEIAQQEAASGEKPFVKIWMHTGFLTINGKKMSKSLKNFITIKSFLEKNEAKMLRLMVFQHHYRSPMNYNEKLLESARNTWSNIKLFMDKLDFFINYRKSNGGGIPDAYLQESNLFEVALSDDMNTPVALSLIFNVMNNYNEMLSVKDHASLVKARNSIKEKLLLFGILPSAPKIPSKIKDLFEKREKYRGNKQFIQSDALRQKLNALGYVVEDTSFGSFISPK